MSLSFVKNNAFLYDDADFADCQLIHFRLTDSALRDLEHLAGTLGEEKFQMSITGTKNSFVIPLADHPSTFTFSITNLNNSNDGSFDCLRICRGRIRCLGKVHCRFTVNAKEDSFSMAREKMVQLEDEIRRSQTKEINSYRKQPRRLGANLVDSKKHINSQKLSKLADPRLTLSHDPLSTNYVNSSGSSSHGHQFGNSLDCRPSPPFPNRSVSHRSLRERIIHILALRPYQRPELLVRLKRDGLSQLQKDQLDDILSEVGQLGRRSAYHLIPSVLSELDPFWPGYSTGEKNRILSLKERTRVSQSTGSPLNRLPTVPRMNTAAMQPLVEDDEFSRRPTRASAPSAPHALSKKIAALDLLAQGISETEVTCRIGVSRDLLSQWRAAETELRERFARLNANSVSAKQNIAPPMMLVSRTQTLPMDQMARTCSLSKPRTFGSASPSSIDESPASPPMEPNISPPKRTRLMNVSVSQPSRDLDTTSSLAQNHSSSCYKPRVGMADSGLASYGVIDRQCCGSNLCDDVSRSSHVNSSHALSPSALRDTPDHTIYVHQQHQQTHFGSGGSEGESAAHTPCSNISSGSSTYGGIPPGQLNTYINAADCGVRRATRNSSALRLSSCGLPQPISCDLDEPSGTQDSVCDNDARRPDENPYQTAASNEFESLSSQESSRMAEIDRMFPRITEARQVALYRMEFKRTYPDYLQLYQSFTEHWKAINAYYVELLEATRREGVESLASTRIADQLDTLLEQSRSQQNCEKKTELNLMVHKLRLLKRRISEFRESQARLNTTASELSRTESRLKDSVTRDRTHIKQPPTTIGSNLNIHTEQPILRQNLDSSGNGRGVNSEISRSNQASLV